MHKSACNVVSAENGALSKMTALISNWFVKFSLGFFYISTFCAHLNGEDRCVLLGSIKQDPCVWCF